MCSELGSLKFGTSEYTMQNLRRNQCDDEVLEPCVKVLSSATPGMYILHVSHHQGVTNTELTPRPLPSTQSCPAPTHKAGWGRVTQPAPSYSCIRSRGNTNTPTHSRATASSITIAEEHETWNKGWNSKHPVALPGSPREQAHQLTTWK